MGYENRFTEKEAINLKDNDLIPRASAFVKDLTSQALGYRDECDREIDRHNKALAFWERERQVVIGFLNGDHTENGDLVESKPMPMENKMARSY